MVQARSSQILEWPCTWRVVPAGPARQPPAELEMASWEIVGGLLSSNPPFLARVPPNFTPHAPATYGFSFSSGRRWRVMW